MQVDIGSWVVVWYRDDYIKEANKTVYKDFNSNGTILSDWLRKAIKVLRIFTNAYLLLRKKSNTFPMISKNQLINYIYYLKFITGFIMCLEYS